MTMRQNLQCGPAMPASLYLQHSTEHQANANISHKLSTLSTCNRLPSNLLTTYNSKKTFFFYRLNAILVKQNQQRLMIKFQEEMPY